MCPRSCGGNAHSRARSPPRPHGSRRVARGGDPPAAGTSHQPGRRVRGGCRNSVAHELAHFGDERDRLGATLPRAARWRPTNQSSAACSVSKGLRHGLPTSGRRVRLPDGGPNGARRLGRSLTSADKDTPTEESRPSGWDVGSVDAWCPTSSAVLNTVRGFDADGFEEPPNEFTALTHNYTANAIRTQSVMIIFSKPSAERRDSSQQTAAHGFGGTQSQHARRRAYLRGNGCTRQGIIGFPRQKRRRVVPASPSFCEGGSSR